jgi:hypothetical protein
MATPAAVLPSSPESFNLLRSMDLQVIVNHDETLGELGS